MSKKSLEPQVIKRWIWSKDGLSVGQSVMRYPESGTWEYRTEEPAIRLHIGLRGAYHFECPELGMEFSLEGSHNNLLFTNGLTLRVSNHSPQIETFGIGWTPERFLKLAGQGNQALKKFAVAIKNGQDTILSPAWRTNTLEMDQIIRSMLNPPFAGEDLSLFLEAKTTELLVHLAAQHAQQPQKRFPSPSERRKLISGRDLLHQLMEEPPTIPELSAKIGLNEYKLKKGFRELFGVTVLGYVQNLRMQKALKLLRETEKSAKEIAYEIGYSSPQHFSRRFKQFFGHSPKSMRKNPDSATASPS